MAITELEIVFRLVLATILGGVVGFERETHNRPAGLRTHILVCLGAALMMLISVFGIDGQLAPNYRVDLARIAAGVVTGIGFLGAGTIMRNREGILGLTTAASIWVVCGIGLATGIGFYTGAVTGTVLVLIILYLLGRLDRSVFSQRRSKGLWIRALDQPGLMGKVGAVLGEFKVNIRTMNIAHPKYEPLLKEDIVSMEFQVTVPLDLELDILIRRLSCLKGVLSISWDSEEVFMAVGAPEETDTLL